MEQTKGGICKEEILGRTSCIVSIVVTVDGHNMETFSEICCVQKGKLYGDGEIIEETSEVQYFSMICSL